MEAAPAHPGNTGSNESACVPEKSALKHWRIWLAAIVFLALGLRLYGIGDRSFWYDEGVILYVSKYLSDPIQFLDPELCNDAPLHVVLAGLWYKAVLAIPGVEAGSKLCDGLIRLYPCAVSVAGVWLAFIVMRRLTRDTLSALFAAFICAIAPFQIYYAQDLRAYALHVTLNLAAVYCMLRALDENKARFWMGYVLAVTAGIYNHFFMVWCVIAFNVVYVATMRGHWRLTLHWAAAQLGVILLSAPALSMALYVNLVFETSQEVWYEKPGLRLVLITFKTFFAGYSANILAYQVLTLAAAAAVLLGVFALRKHPRSLAFLVLLAATPIVIGVLYWRTKDFPYFTHRLFVFSAVPCYMLAAAGMARVPWRAGRVALLGAFTILTLPALADYYAQRIHPVPAHTLGILYKPDNRAAAHFIRDRLDPERDVVAHRIRYTKMPFDYYLDARQAVVELTERQGVAAMSGYPSIRAYETGDIFPVRLDTLLDDAERLWLVNTWWRPFDPEPGTSAMWQWLDAHAIRELREPFDGVDVFRYRTKRPGGRIAIVQDTGKDRAPLYYAPGQGRIENDLALLAASLSRAVETASDIRLGFEYAFGDGGGLDLIGADTEAGDTMFASFPASAGETAATTFIVENRSAALRKLDFNIYPSAELLAATDFELLDRDSSVWQYGYQLPPAPELPVPNRLAVIARLSTQSPMGKAIAAPLRLDPGSYNVWIRVKTSRSAVNHDGARARFFLYDGEDSHSFPFASVVPMIGALPNGWHWLHIGRANVTPETKSLRIAVDNPSGLDDASFHLDRVRFLPEGVLPQPHRLRLDLEPHTTRKLSAAPPMLDLSMTRFDLDMVEAATATHRNLSFYTVREEE